ncbi:hypothetical protein ABE493_07760 [Stenotrophomonas terrae]|uniref:hypothetical protein n=1 Tax=Stenotrophomonas terrae TaxID=405446 RepID=UPI00320A94CF
MDSNLGNCEVGALLGAPPAESREGEVYCLTADEWAALRLPSGAGEIPACTAGAH